MSSSVHEASAELIGEVSRRDGGVRDRASTPSSRCATPPICSANRGRHLASRQCGSEIEHQPPRHFVPLPLYAPQTGGDNHGVGDTVSTPSSRCATPPMCSANRGRQSCQPVWVRDRASTPLSLRATPPMCFANRGRQSCSQRGCSPVGWQKMSSSVHGALAELIGEVSRRDGGVGKYLFNQSEPPRHVVPLPLYAPQTGGDNLARQCGGSPVGAGLT